MIGQGVGSPASSSYLQPDVLRATLWRPTPMFGQASPADHAFLEEGEAGMYSCCLDLGKLDVDAMLCNELCSLADGTKRLPGSHNSHKYPPGMKLKQILASGGSCLLLFTVMYWSVRGFSAFLSMLGLPLQVGQLAQQPFLRI